MKLTSSSLFPRALAAYGAYLVALVVRGMEVLGKLGLYILAARVLGVHDSGLFFLCLTWVGLVATVSRAGFEKAAMRHIAAELAVGRGAEARHALLLGTACVVGASALATLATLLLARPLAVHVFGDGELAVPLMISAAAILPQAMCVYLGHALTGFKRGIAGQFVQNSLWPVLTFAALPLGVHSLHGILYALIAACVIATVVGVVLLARERRQLAVKPSEDETGREHLPPLWRTAWPLGFVEMTQVGLNSLPVLILAVFASPAAVGAFSVANRISQLIWVIIIAISTIAAPAFAAHHRQEQWDQLRALNRRTRLAIALTGAPVILGMLAAPAGLLHLVGPGFEIAATALVIMGAGQLVNCLLPTQDVVLAMTGHGMVLRWLNTAQIVTCLGLCFLLIPPFGMIGAAIATAAFTAQGGIGTTIAVLRLMPRAF